MLKTLSPLNILVAISLLACWLLVCSLQGQQYTEYQTCKPAEFKGPDTATGRYCAFDPGTNACWGNNTAVAALACAGMEESSVVPGVCNATTSKIECMAYDRTISNYVHTKVVFQCDRVKNAQGIPVVPPQCACYYTPTLVAVNPFVVSDCTSRNFP